MVGHLSTHKSIGISTIKGNVRALFASNCSGSGAHFSVDGVGLSHPHTLKNNYIEEYVRVRCKEREKERDKEKREEEKKRNSEKRD